MSALLLALVLAGATSRAPEEPRCYALTYGRWQPTALDTTLYPQVPDGVILTSDPDTLGTRLWGWPSRFAQFWVAGPRIAEGVWSPPVPDRDSVQATLRFHWSYGLSFRWAPVLGTASDTLGAVFHGRVTEFSDDAGATWSSTDVAARRVHCPARRRRGA